LATARDGSDRVGSNRNPRLCRRSFGLANRTGSSASLANIGLRAKPSLCSTKAALARSWYKGETPQRFWGEIVLGVLICPRVE